MPVSVSLLLLLDDVDVDDTNDSRVVSIIPNFSKAVLVGAKTVHSASRSSRTLSKLVSVNNSQKESKTSVSQSISKIGRHRCFVLDAVVVVVVVDVVVVVCADDAAAVEPSLVLMSLIHSDRLLCTSPSSVAANTIVVDDDDDDDKNTEAIMTNPASCKARSRWP